MKPKKEKIETQQDAAVGVSPEHPQAIPAQEKAQCPPAPETAEKKAMEYYDQLLRLKAEFENYRKRVEREKSDLIKWGKAELLLKLIPLYDVLLNAHCHVNKILEQEKSACQGGADESTGKIHDSQSHSFLKGDENGSAQTHCPQGKFGQSRAGELCKGLELIFGEFSKVFEAEGINIMETVGKPYDPMSHEVIGTVENSPADDGSVVEEIQRGFVIGGKVLRPARVRIAQKKRAEPGTEQTKTGEIQKEEV